MQLVIMEVTPEQAQTWLATKKRNRRQSPFVIRRYARMMEEGDWKASTNESIAFNHEGQLIDGEQRLAAVIRYGKPVRMAIAFGCETHVGIVRTRSTNDIAQIVFDEKLPKNAAAIVRVMHLNPNMTPFEVMNAYHRHQVAVDYAASILKGCDERHIQVAPVQAAIARAYKYFDEERLTNFCKALRTGVMHYTIDVGPVQLAKWLRNQADGKRNSMSPLQRMHCAEWVINQYMNNKAVKSTKSIKVPDTELFPLPPENDPFDGEAVSTD